MEQPILPETQQPISDSLTMIASMTPVLQPGIFVYAKTRPPWPSSTLIALIPLAHSVFNEAEGMSLLVPVSVCQDPTHSDILQMVPPLLRHIELRVFSSLEGVGLTAAVAGALTREEIACNVVAGLMHDHVFVPEQDAERAVLVLQGVSDDAQRALKLRQQQSSRAGPN